MPMKTCRLTFKQQMLVGIGLMILSVILSQVFHDGIFHNIAWIIYGLLCILNPDWPKSWTYAGPQKMKKGYYIAGAICIMIGLLTRFGI